MNKYLLIGLLAMLIAGCSGAGSSLTTPIATASKQRSQALQPQIGRICR